MKKIDRRKFIAGGLGGLAAGSPLASAFAQSRSLQELGASTLAAPQATVFTAREIVTLNPNRPSAQAVAVVNGRILWVGSLEEVTGVLSDQPYRIDDSFGDRVLVPGFVAQHDHPVLAALTMSSEILSIEDWVLPGGTVPAVEDKPDFLRRLAEAVRTGDPARTVLSWGYHPAFYGPLTRRDLDEVSTERPIIVWARSCHEMFLNSRALDEAGVTRELVDGFGASARRQSDLEAGRFWEQGLFGLLPHIATMVADPERLRAGLELTRDYMHAKGVTIGNEPGGILSRPVQDAVNAVFSSPDMPFRWSFMADGKSLVAAHDDDSRVLEETTKLASWYGGMTSLAPRQAKLFADGAIYSQLMQVREPYLDGHEGEWMMDKDDFERAFRIYWDAGYQIHVHVNGDAGVDRVLDALESNLRRNPRYDHRTVLVHFAVSGPDQVARIKNLGAIVSGNPYYVTALADQYSEVGLGPQRADSMVRLGDLTRAGVSWSLHSDMPMAPADPLFLMWCAVNRRTASGRIAGPDQRVSAEAALRGVTIDAAYSLRMDHEIGSIAPGKRANFTILGDNPLTVDPMAIRDVPVTGTIMEGRVLLPGSRQQEAPSSTASTNVEFTRAALDHALRVVHAHLPTPIRDFRFRNEVVDS